MTNELVSDQPFEGLGRSYMLTDHQGSAPLVMAEYDSIAATIADDGRQHVLDWGCGFGHSAWFLRDRGVDVELFDYVPDFDGPAVRSLSLYPEMTATLSSDPVVLPYEDSTFDGVLSLGTLEHVGQPRESLAEIRRVLKPGGLLYVYKLPNRYSYVEFLARKTGRYYHGALANDRIYTSTTAKQLLESSGFAILSGGHRNMFPLRTMGRWSGEKRVKLVRTVSDLISSTPFIRVFATNLEYKAVRLS